MSLLAVENINLQSRKTEKIYKPNRVVTLGILDAGSISVFCNIGVYVFHQQVGCKDSMHKVSPNVTVVEVVLEQRWHLYST